MNEVFVVRAEEGGAPESYIMGVYTTEEQAKARVAELCPDGSENWSRHEWDAFHDRNPDADVYEFAWYDVCPLDTATFLSNR